MLTGRRSIGRAVGERLHAVDQGADPVGLVADQPDQRPLVLGDAALQQLRRAADPRERVLDLVRQGRAQPGDRARAAAVRQLPVQPLRHRAGVQHDQVIAALLVERRHVQVDQMRFAAAEQQLDAVVGHAVAALADPADQIEQRAVERQQLGQRPALEHRPADAEQLLGGRVDEHDRERPVDREHGARHRVEDRSRVAGGSVARHLCLRHEAGRTLAELPLGVVMI